MVYLRCKVSGTKATCVERDGTSGTMSHFFGIFQNDTWIRAFALWWFRGSVSPSGSKVLQVDSRTEDQLKINWRERGHKAATHQLQADSSFLNSSIYWALSYELRRLEFCAKQGSAVGLQLELLGDCFYRGEEEISCCWGGAAGLEPFMVVTFSEPFSFINKALMFSYILVLQWCIVFICIFDSF